MPFPRPTLTALRAQAMQDVTASGLPNADGFLRRGVLRILAWVQAGLAQLHYGYLDWIAIMATPFTALGEYLEGWAAIAPTPVLREAPTYASGPVTFSGTIGYPLPSGTIVLRDDNVQYQTVATVTVGGGGTVTPTIVALIAGSNGNTDAGAPFTLGVVVNGIVPASTSSGPIVGGNDLEQDAALKTRMLESYAAPPHGGNGADYVTWALQVPGVTRAWTPQVPPVPGAVTVFFMMDVAEAAFNGFPQGTNGVATAETRDVAATGDQLAVANYLFPLRPVTPIVYAVAPVASPVNLTLGGLATLSTGRRALVAAALTALFLQKDSPLQTTSIEQSDIAAAITAIAGLPSFAITSPTSWPLTSAFGALFTLGTVTYV